MGIDEGATLIASGVGRPKGLQPRYYVQPTVLANVEYKITISKKEIIDPVLVVIPFDTEAEAIQLENNTPYGLAAFIQAGDSERAIRVVRQFETLTYLNERLCS